LVHPFTTRAQTAPNAGERLQVATAEKKNIAKLRFIL